MTTNFQRASALLLRERLPFSVVGWGYIKRPCEFVWWEAKRVDLAVNAPIYLGRDRPDPPPQPKQEALL